MSFSKWTLQSPTTHGEATTWLHFNILLHWALTNFQKIQKCEDTKMCLFINLFIYPLNFFEFCFVFVFLIFASWKLCWMTIQLNLESCILTLMLYYLINIYAFMKWIEFPFLLKCVIANKQTCLSWIFRIVQSISGIVMQPIKLYVFI